MYCIYSTVHTNEGGGVGVTEVEGREGEGEGGVDVTIRNGV